jgi:hypothetical protein
MLVPYWITDSLIGLPLYALVIVAIGLPWARVLLAPAERGSRALLLTVAIPVGFALITAWLLVLGTLGAMTGEALIRPVPIAAGAAGLSLAGVILALRRRGARRAAPPLHADERLLIGLIALAVGVAAIVTAYWSFTAYDALWVYGYQGRLYALTGVIAHSIDYYPQFMPLLYALGQLDGINDHTARAVVPLLHLGAILAAYALGRLIDGRRTGVVLAGLWALYPHVGEWSRAGDLEIPLTLSFTLASAFFLRAWLRAGRGAPGWSRDASIAGLAFGVALWTKPTAGAFALGVALMVAIAVVQAYAEHRTAARIWQAVRPRFSAAVITALTCAPLGGVWYVRNLALGHSAVDFPPPFWQTLAERGGDDFGFPLLALGLCVGFVWWRFRSARHLLLLVGVGLCCAAVARSILTPDLTLEARRMTPFEIGLLLAGGGLVMWQVMRFVRTVPGTPLRALTRRVGWAGVLAAPYFVVWFWSYSYHYRLSFAVVPLLLLPTAMVLARLTHPVRLSVTARVALLPLIALASLPGILSPIPDKFVGEGYLFTDMLPDDDARYRSGNAALMWVVDGLRIWKRENPGERLVVAAPGVVRLPFFFPLDDIRADAHPTRLAEIEDAAYFVYGIPETAGGYAEVSFFENQVIGVLGRDDLLRRAWWMDDGIFSYDVYELHLNRRWQRPTMNGPAGEDVVFGGFARYIGYDLGGLELWQGRPVVATLYFESIAPAADDLSIFLHLRDDDGRVIAAWDDPVGRGELGYQGYYSTLMWQPGEFITETRTIRLPDGVAPFGEGYSLHIGLYNAVTLERVPVFVDGVPHGDSYRIENRISIVPPP